MLKRILAVILSVAIIGIPVFASSQFADLPGSHWGYASVSKLVSDGTVKGYEDGSFRPDNTVTRAEFVKMMGVGTERKADDYTDVPKDHWGYEYIMTSGFNLEGTEFLPDKPITRGEVIELLWKRQGSKTGLIAPNAITSQKADNKDAVAWAYNHKIMMGDDGLNLRLYDSISRVEAAALIIRTRETDYNAPMVNFKDAVSENVLKAAFESYRLFDVETLYSAEKTITNGEMARAALRLALNEYNLSYGLLKGSASFEHKYAKDIAIIINNAIGNTEATKEYADKPATIEDTVAAFAFATIQNSKASLSANNKDNYYKDITGDISSEKNRYLTFAYENGIQPNSDGTIGAGRNVTHKDIALLLIQFDSISGLNTLYSTAKDEKGKYKEYDAKLSYAVNSYPSNKDSFVCITENTDNILYEKPVETKKNAKSMDEMYDFAREYNALLITHVEQLALHIKNTYGVDSELIMYPNLTWDNGERFVLRMKCRINSVSKPDIDVQSIFAGTLLTPVTDSLSAGMEFFIEIQTGNYMSVLLGM